MYELLFQSLPLAVSTLFDTNVIVGCLIGAAIGFVVGAIPGIGSTVGIALTMPLMVEVNPIVALCMFMCTYMGGEFGGAVSAILINIPGQGSAAATVLDGYPMSKKGKAITALSIAALSSFWGGIFSPILLILTLPFLSQFILVFGTPEFFLLGLLGVTCITAASDKSMIKGLIVGFFGLMLCSVGISPVNAQQRFTFGSIYLFDGFGFLPALIGLFGVAEMMRLILSKNTEISSVASLQGSRMEGFLLAVKNWRTMIRSSLIGLFIGLIPGVGATTASFVSWAQAKRASKNPEEFGKGNPEGVVACEASNNSVVGGALMPTLLFGIPGSATTAVVLGGLLMLGVQPGQALFKGEGLIQTEVILLSLIFASVFLLIIGLFVAPYFGKITLLRKELLVPTVFVLAAMGIYIANNSMFDVVLIIAFGLLGFLLVCADFPLFPLVLALILGTMIESNLLRTISLSGGDVFAYLLGRPACIVIIAIVLLLFIVFAVKSAMQSRKKAQGRSNEV